MVYIPSRDLAISTTYDAIATEFTLITARRATARTRKHVLLEVHPFGEYDKAATTVEASIQ